MEVADAPMHDKFQVITVTRPMRSSSRRRGYLGLTYSHDLIIIQVTWVSGRSTEVKKKFFRQVAEDIHAKGGVGVVTLSKRRREAGLLCGTSSGRDDLAPLGHRCGAEHAVRLS
jgi:Tautomerase enzyme